MIQGIKDYIKKNKERLITANNTIDTHKYKKTKMGRKTTIRKFQVTNWRDCTQENMDMTKRGKFHGRN